MESEYGFCEKSFYVLVLSEISHQSNANQMMDVGVSLQD